VTERPASAEARGSAEILVLAACQLHHAQLVAHPPPRHHASGNLRHLLAVVLGTRRPRPVHDLLRRTTSQCPDYPRPQVRFGIVVTVAVRPLVRDAERLAPRNDRYAVHRIGSVYHESENRMPAFVIRDALPVLRGQQQRPFRTEYDLLERIHEVGLPYVILIAARRQESGLVHEVPYVGSG